jgi:hypothetical protein
MRQIAPFQDIRASLRDAICFGRFQTRAEARAYVQLPLSRQKAAELSALADSERSPAIYRRVWLENERRVA